MIQIEGDFFHTFIGELNRRLLFQDDPSLKLREQQLMNQYIEEFLSEEEFMAQLESHTKMLS